MRAELSVKGNRGTLTILRDISGGTSEVVHQRSIHAVGRKGSIRISTAVSETGDRLSIRVADDGHGIEPRHLNKIFDPFFTTKTTGEGTGLGLSVSYGIVKNHGGHIHVESRPGEGSVFTVVLPSVSTA